MTHSRPILRALLRKVLKTDSDLDAFCGDYFPKVRNRFTGSMDQIAKVTMLLDYAQPARIVEALEEAHPESVRDFEREQKARPQSYSELAELDKVRDGAEPPPELGQPLPPAPPAYPQAAAPHPAAAGATAASYPAIPGATAAPYPAAPGAPAGPHAAAPGVPASPAKQDSVRRTIVIAAIVGVLLVGISGLVFALIRSGPTSDTEQPDVALRGASGSTDPVDNPDAARTGPRGPSTPKPNANTSSPPTTPATSTSSTVFPIEAQDAGVKDAGVRDGGSISVPRPSTPYTVRPGSFTIPVKPKRDGG